MKFINLMNESCKRLNKELESSMLISYQYQITGQLTNTRPIAYPETG
jgi:hypothetical protein